MRDDLRGYIGNSDELLVIEVTNDSRASVGFNPNGTTGSTSTLLGGSLPNPQLRRFPRLRPFDESVVKTNGESQLKALCAVSESFPNRISETMALFHSLAESRTPYTFDRRERLAPVDNFSI